MPDKTFMIGYWHFRFMMVVFLSVCQGSSPARAEDSETELRRNLACQSALERIGLSPGIIDGRIGAKTVLAIKEFQRVRGLPRTGRLDKVTAEALKLDPAHVVGWYTVQANDLAEIGPVPKSWLARSKLKRLGYESVEAALAEKFHCTRQLLATLNPGKKLNQLKPGDKVVVPIVPEPVEYPRAARIEINLSEKVIRVINYQKKLVALFHCSIAARKSKLPKSDARITVVAMNPNYTFDPEKWPEVKEKITRKLNIPPGPRNPVGRCWIGLSLPGYGIHGTPRPEEIGKTGSHGCFRLTNWDAVRLGKMVRVGVPVHFVGRPG